MPHSAVVDLFSFHHYYLRMYIDKTELGKLYDMFTTCAPIFTALGDANRPKLILDIADAGEGGANVSTLAAKSHLSRPAVSHHLKVLRDSGFVTTLKRGTQIFYRLNLVHNLDKIDTLVHGIQEVIERVKETQLQELNSSTQRAIDAIIFDMDGVLFDSESITRKMWKQAAQEYPEVQFCHATGTQAHTKGLKNFHNAFASIYEGRYLAGIAAGMKLNEMIKDGKIKAEEAKIGYVGAFDYAEVVSGFTSFFLGARSVCESATMKVTYTKSWFDIALEREAALSLINDGCVLISQHADSEGAPKACEEKGVPNVAYNISTISMGPNTAIISSKINWAPYYKLVIEAVAKGEAIPTDWCGTIATGSVGLTELNEKVAASGTQAKLDEVKAQLEKGEIKDKSEYKECYNMGKNV